MPTEVEPGAEEEEPSPRVHCSSSRMPLENAVRSWKELMWLSLQRLFTASAGLAVIKVAMVLSSHKPSDTPNSWEFPDSHFSKLLPFKNFLFGALWIFFFCLNVISRKATIKSLTVDESVFLPWFKLIYCSIKRNLKERWTEVWDIAFCI